MIGGMVQRYDKYGRRQIVPRWVQTSGLVVLACASAVVLFLAFTTG